MIDPDERPIEGSDERAVYIISVAAELAGVHPQTLRIYEQKGLVQPQRTSGNVRRYSHADIVRLRHIHRLTTGGVNLAGARRIIELEEEIELLHEQVAQLESMLEDRPIPMPGRRSSVEILPVASLLRPPWVRGRRR